MFTVASELVSVQCVCHNIVIRTANQQIFMFYIFIMLFYVFNTNRLFSSLYYTK